ncbi:hypothetical protein E4T56_gene728 [Termitomyces sp. T112]|nr:hypothetical protein E4T56_gene728 [Termitomyces sp. T112]
MSYAAAVALCKPEQTVCGIPGREGTKDFECIDTTTTLDSCGGCVVQHPFSDGPASVNGIDCGRLPGVIASNCLSSRCEIAQCHSGWYLDAKRNECVKFSASTTRRSIGSRMTKAAKRSDLEIETVIAPELATQFAAYARLVLRLKNASQTVPKAFTAPPSIDQAYYVNTIVTATLYTLRSPTVVALMANTDSLVNVNAFALNAFKGCGCIDALGLHSVYDDLIAIVNASLSIQSWCHNHPVSVPSNTIKPTTVPNTSAASITIGLDDVLNALSTPADDPLGLGVSSTLTEGAATGIPIKVDSALLSQIQGLVNLTLTIQDGSTVLPAASFNGTGAPLPGPVPINGNLVTSIVQATLDVLNSGCVRELLNNLQTLGDVNAVLQGSLAGCGCVDQLGLAGLVKDVDALLAAVLDLQSWCANHPVVVPSDSHTSSLPTPTTVSTTTTVGFAGPNSHLLDLKIDLGLGDLVSALTPGLTNNADTTIDLKNLLTTLVGVVVQIQNDSTSLPLTSTTTIALPAVSAPATPLASLTQGIIDTVQAVAVLLNSTTTDNLLTNVNALLNLSNLLNESIDRCGCVDSLGLHTLVDDLNALGDALLSLHAWCKNHPGGNRPGGSVSGADTISIDTHDLLTMLGLDTVLQGLDWEVFGDG